MAVRPRRLMVVRGAPETTAQQARDLVARIPSQDVLWVDESGVDLSGHARVVSPREVRHLLGRAFEAVVLDMHAGMDPDVLAQAAGFAWEGGALILRLPSTDDCPPGMSERVVVPPLNVAEAGTRTWHRFLAALERSPARVPPVVLEPPVARAPTGSAEQAHVVNTLAQAMVDGGGALFTLTADRGRGKSAALGLAASRALALRPDMRVVLLAPTEDAASEVVRFAPALVPVTSAEDVLGPGPDMDVLFVDEAARFPVAVLRALALRHARACCVFSSTVAGYEGTGRGFLLRFAHWCREQPHARPPLVLEEPIRWGNEDPVEKFVADVTLLDARPAVVNAEPANLTNVVTLDRDQLVRDERRLRAFIGLLVHAHYRTTPSDVHRALDAPNISLHAVMQGDAVVAACMVAREGGLSQDTCMSMVQGRTRIRGHALADTLVSHCALPPAGELDMVRSIRIAVHPDARRRGLASLLVEHVHAACPAELHGTLFGATPELLRFRRSVGYRLVRVGVSRGERSGELSVVMARPTSARAKALVQRLQRDLAWALPEQLELLAGSPLTHAPPELADALAEGMVTPPVATHEDVLDAVHRYAEGVQPVEAAAWAIRRVLQEHPSAVESLGADERALLHRRVMERHAWSTVLPGRGAPSAMRAMRGAVRQLLQAVQPGRNAAWPR